MDIQQQRTLISGRIWKSLAQSGVEISALPREQLDALVGALTDGVLAGIDAALGQVGAAAGGTLGAAAPAASEPAEDNGEERVIWSGRPFLSVIDYIEVTNQRIRIKHGLFNVAHENIDLVRIKDVDYTQNVAERAVNIGDITISSADTTEPVAVLRNVHNPEDLHNIIRQAVLAARQRQRVQLRDEM